MITTKQPSLTIINHVHEVMVLDPRAVIPMLENPFDFSRCHSEHFEWNLTSKGQSSNGIPMIEKKTENVINIIEWKLYRICIHMNTFNEHLYKNLHPKSHHVAFSNMPCPCSTMRRSLEMGFRYGLTACNWSPLKSSIRPGRYTTSSWPQADAGLRESSEGTYTGTTWILGFQRARHGGTLKIDAHYNGSSH